MVLTMPPRSALSGVLLVIAGIGGRIEAHAHAPVAAEHSHGLVIVLEPHGASGLAPGLYNLALIGCWALLLFGALLIAFGLIGALRKDSR